MIEFLIGTFLGFGIGIFLMAILQIGESYERYDIEEVIE